MGTVAPRAQDPKKGSQIAASAPPACPCCSSSCRGHCGSVGTPCPSCTGMAGLDGGGCRGGASAWLHKVLPHPQPGPATNMGLSEQELGTSKGHFPELCSFRVPIPKSLIPRHSHSLHRCPLLPYGADLTPNFGSSTGCQSQLRAQAGSGKRQVHRASSKEPQGPAKGHKLEIGVTFREIWPRTSPLGVPAAATKPQLREESSGLPGDMGGPEVPKVLRSCPVPSQK